MSSPSSTAASSSSSASTLLRSGRSSVHVSTEYLRHVKSVFDLDTEADDAVDSAMLPPLGVDPSLPPGVRMDRFLDLFFADVVGFRACDTSGDTRLTRRYLYRASGVKSHVAHLPERPSSLVELASDVVVKRLLVLEARDPGASCDARSVYGNDFVHYGVLEFYDPREPVRLRQAYPRSSDVYCAEVPSHVSTGSLLAAMSAYVASFGATFSLDPALSYARLMMFNGGSHGGGRIVDRHVIYGHWMGLCACCGGFLREDLAEPPDGVATGDDALNGTGPSVPVPGGGRPVVAAAAGGDTVPVASVSGEVIFVMDDEEEDQDPSKQ